MPPLVIETPQSLREFVGREIAMTDWFTVTQERIRQFAEVTEDKQWIHVDRERAQKRIAVWHDDRSRFLDAVAGEPLHERGDPNPERSPDGCQLRIEQSPLPFPRTRGSTDSCPRDPSFREGASRLD